MQGQTEVLLTARQCCIKTQFLNLQERVELEFQNNFYKFSTVEKVILNQAKVLSDDILKAHNEKADCECFSTVASNVCTSASDKGKMMERLNGLKGLLERLDTERNGHKKKYNINISKSALNPFSSCFVPKSFSQVYEPHLRSCLPPRNEDRFKNVPTVRPLRVRNEEVKSHAETLNRSWKNFSNSNGLSFIKNDPISDSKLLLNCFYGLNSHFATDPSGLKISCRPAKFTSIWSVMPEDHNLWNANTLGLSPVFNYNLPSKFCGDDDDRKSCSEDSSYQSFPGSELDDLDSVSNYYPKLYPFDLPIIEDEECVIEHLNEEGREERIEGYKDKFTQLVTEICELTKTLETDSSRTRVSQAASDEGISMEEEASKPKVKPKDSVLQYNPAWRNILCADMMKGLIYDSSAWNLSNAAFSYQTHGSFSKSEKLKCDPPCSVWCDSKFSKSGDHALCELQKSAVVSAMENGYTLVDDRPSNMADRCFQPFKGQNQDAIPAVGETLNKVPKPNPLPKLNDSMGCANSENRNLEPSFRYRHASGDSGYQSEHSNLRKKCETPSEFEESASDFTATPYDNEMWTPLPNCVRTTQLSEGETPKATAWNPVYDRRLPKSKNKQRRPMNNNLAGKDK